MSSRPLNLEVVRLASKLWQRHSAGECVNLRMKCGNRTFAISSVEVEGEEPRSELSVDILECPICLDPFVDARLLPCGHSICGACIKLLSSTKSTQKICPVCRKSFSRSNEFPPNFIVNNVKSCNRWKKEKEDLAAILLSLQTDELPALRLKLLEMEGVQLDLTLKLDQKTHESLAIEDERSQQAAQIDQLVCENNAMKTMLEKMHEHLLECGNTSFSTAQFFSFAESEFEKSISGPETTFNNFGEGGEDSKSSQLPTIKLKKKKNSFRQRIRSFFSGS